MITRFLLSTIFLTMFLISHGEKKYRLSGTMTDINQEPINGTFYIPKIKKGTVANVLGEYTISLPQGIYQVEIRAVGFKTEMVTIELNGDMVRDFVLRPDTELLNAVKVTAKRADDNVKNPLIGVQTLQAKEIELLPSFLGEPDLIKSLLLLPGVSAGLETGNGISVRGGNYDQNLVLLDNASIYNLSHIFGLLSVFNNDVIGSVDLYKGGIPAQYGGRLSSVLVVNQKDDMEGPIHGSLNVSTISSKASVYGSLFDNKVTYLFGGRTSYLGIFLTGQTPTPSIGFNDLNGKVTYRINSRNKLSLSGYRGRDNFGLADFFNTNWGNTTATLKWDNILNENLFLDVWASYSQYDYVLNIDFIELEWTTFIRDYKLKTNFTHLLSQKVKLEYGFESSYKMFNPGTQEKISEQFAVAGDGSLDRKYGLESAVYVSTENKLGNFTLQYGLRFSNFLRLGPQPIQEYVNDEPIVYDPVLGIYNPGVVSNTVDYESGEIIKSFFDLEPRLSLAYQVSPTSSVKFGAHRIVQYMKEISNNTSPVPNSVWSPSGRYFDPSTAYQISTGYFRNFNDNTWETSAEIYYKWSDNLLDYTPGSELIQQNYLETVSLEVDGRAYGLELFVKKRTGKFNGWVSYTFAVAEQKSVPLDASDVGINDGSWYRANQDIRHNLSLTALFKASPKWEFSSITIFQTGRPISYPYGGYQTQDNIFPNYERRNTYSLPNYVRVDLSAIYHFNTWMKGKAKPKLSIGAYNSFNIENTLSVYFEDDRDTGELGAYQITSFGIIPFVAFTVDF